MSRKENQEKLSIAFLFDDTLDSSDGVAQNVKILGSWLNARGHEVTYLVGESELKTWAGGSVHSLSKNVRVNWSGNRLSIPLLPRLKTINRVIKKKTFDIVHVQVPYSPIMAQVVINRLPRRTALVGTVHIFPANSLSIIGSKLLRISYAKSLKRFDEMLSVSPAAQTYARSSLGVKTKVVPNPVELKKFQRPEPRQARVKGRIVFLGRLVKRKGCAELIKAFAVLASGNSEATLVIAGDGPLRRELENLAKKNGTANRVNFIGYVEESQKADILASASIACFPSLYGESFGVVLTEAMAAGAGVVLGGANPGYKTVLGFLPETLFDPRDTKKFARQLEQILSDGDLAHKIHSLQQAEVKKYDVDRIGRQLLEVYNQAIASRLQSRHN